MKKITFRNLEERDLSEIKQLILKNWEWTKQIKNAETLEAVLNLYLNEILNQTTFAVVAELEGRVAGTIMCSAVGVPPEYRMLQDNGMATALTLMNAEKGEREGIVRAIMSLYGAYQEHLEGQKYQGNIVFLAVSPEAQGLKLGRKLWDHAVNYFRVRGIETMYLFSDTGCNFGFYEHIGMHRRDEQSLEFDFQGNVTQLTTFLYDYDIRLNASM